ncbi:MAG: hypothetical protein KF830_11185 [Planctomycetes bacterium]|nr:hypothetical protein [Planctomycetota bacterium]
MTGIVLQRLVLAALVAAAGIGVVGSAWLLAHGTVPDALLPLAILGGLAAAARHRPPAWPGEPTPRWLAGIAVAVVLGAAALIAYGALATPSRHWDGAVAWDLKAHVLAANPTLQQPFFRDPAVYCQSRDYPLLQPLLLGLCERWHLPGRLLFPAAYLLLIASIHGAARSAGIAGRRAVLWALAAAVTPVWLSPSAGSFDSGYGDAALTAWLAAAGFGAAAGNVPVLACGLLLTVLQKPEGLPYAGLLVAALWLHGDARRLRAATLATAGAGTLVLALQSDLQTFGRPSPWPVLALGAFAAAAVVLGGDAWLRRRGANGRWRALGLLAALPVAIAVAAAVSGGSLATDPTVDGATSLQRLALVPRIGHAMFRWGVGHGSFGLAFVVPLAVVVVLWRTRTPVRSPALGTWLLLLLPLWCMPFLFAPVEDLAEHVPSRLPRLLLHGTGIAWLWAAQQPLSPPAPESALGASPRNP